MLPCTCTYVVYCQNSDDTQTSYKEAGDGGPILRRVVIIKPLVDYSIHAIYAVHFGIIL